MLAFNASGEGKRAKDDWIHGRMPGFLVGRDDLVGRNKLIRLQTHTNRPAKKKTKREEPSSSFSIILHSQLSSASRLFSPLGPAWFNLLGDWVGQHQHIQTPQSRPSLVIFSVCYQRLSTGPWPATFCQSALPFDCWTTQSWLSSIENRIEDTMSSQKFPALRS